MKILKDEYNATTLTLEEITHREIPLFRIKGLGGIALVLDHIEVLWLLEQLQELKDEGKFDECKNV